MFAMDIGKTLSPFPACGRLLWTAPKEKHFFVLIINIRVELSRQWIGEVV